MASVSLAAARRSVSRIALIGPAVQAIAEHVGRLGGAHRQRGHRAAIQVANLQRRFQGVKVLRVENRGNAARLTVPSSFMASAVILAVSGTCLTQTTLS